MNKILVLVLLSVAFPAWTQPKILASIKPLQLIAQAVVGESATVNVLLPPGATPHHYSMRPSDIEKIVQSDFLLWLGSSAEPYLAKLANNHLRKKKMLDITPVEIRREHSEDLHLWLGPKQALAMAAMISERLVHLDPARQDNYQVNLHQFEQQIEDFSARLKQQFSGKFPAYLVYHDAYRYFEAAAGIGHAGVISVHPEIKPGARRVAELRALVARGKVACIFVEPQADIKIIELIVGQYRVKVIRLAPMASLIEADSGSYLEFLENIAEHFGRCQLPLSPRPSP